MFLNMTKQQQPQQQQHSPMMAAFADMQGEQKGNKQEEQEKNKQEEQEENKQEEQEENKQEEQEKQQEEQEEQEKQQDMLARVTHAVYFARFLPGKRNPAAAHGTAQSSTLPHFTRV